MIAFAAVLCLDWETAHAQIAASQQNTMPQQNTAPQRSTAPQRNTMLQPGAIPNDRTSSSSVLNYLKSISGKFTVAGIQNREPNSRPAMQTDRIFDLTGRYPGLWSGDFLYQADDIKNRWTMIRECKKQWDQGAIVQLLLHVAPPNQPEACKWEGGVLSHLSDEQWKDLVTSGSALNKAWKSRLDEYARYLQYLKDNRVQVLFRPHHEMNQKKFWWGGRKGPEGTAKLYRLTHDYLANEKGLDNLIWVWDMQDMTRDFQDYNPGDAYWDLFAFDVYSKGYDKSWYDYILPIARNKPIAIGECEKLPTAQLLAEQPRWCFFMSWAELTFTKNSKQQILDLYQSPNVITRDRLPKFK
ncbi:MAG: glycosyl hydrolase [Candidatus Sumerlaeota bacterium]|nr:glycosyl hydrolase [Candidatus Sumerlaeota bacterium]